MQDFSHDSTILWLHQLGSNKTLGEKAWWQQHKDTVCCFEQIVEVTPHIPPIWQTILQTHLPPILQTIQERLAIHAGYWDRSKDKLISDVLLLLYSHNDINNNNNNNNSTNAGGTNEFISFYLQSLATQGDRHKS